MGTVGTQDSFDCDGSDKEQKCLRLLKNKSDDIERYDHVQFVIREINVAAKSQQDTKKDEQAANDEMEFLCEGNSQAGALSLLIWLIARLIAGTLLSPMQLPSSRRPRSARSFPSI